MNNIVYPYRRRSHAVMFDHRPVACRDTSSSYPRHNIILLNGTIVFSAAASGFEFELEFNNGFRTVFFDRIL